VCYVCVMCVVASLVYGCMSCLVGVDRLGVAGICSVVCFSGLWLVANIVCFVFVCILCLCVCVFVCLCVECLCL